MSIYSIIEQDYINTRVNDAEKKKKKSQHVIFGLNNNEFRDEILKNQNMEFDLHTQRKEKTC